MAGLGPLLSSVHMVVIRNGNGREGVSPGLVSSCLLPLDQSSLFFAMHWPAVSLQRILFSFVLFSERVLSCLIL